MRAGGVGGLALEVQRVAVVRAVAGGGGAGGLELTWKASRKLWKYFGKQSLLSMWTIIPHARGLVSGALVRGGAPSRIIDCAGRRRD